jgi:Flp pilus assembly protein TadD
MKMKSKSTVRLPVVLIVLALASTTILTGCAKDKMSTGSINRQSAAIDQMSDSQLSGTIDTLGAIYDKNPRDKANGLAFAKALQTVGRNDQALAVMKKLAIDHSKDQVVLAAYGKALAGAGQFEPALDAIRRAQTPERPDWRLLSAEGAILDQTGQSSTAREMYRKALDIQPNEPSVLSNLGMSYVLEGDLKTAETYLRNAMAQPGADNRMRQNLAMVIGLQGRYDEAQQVAAQTLSPQEAEANMAYLRSIMAQQNTWADIESEAKAKPKS